MDPRAGLAASRQTTFPEQIVNAEGVINVPFAGAVPVVGQTPQQIEAEVVRRLTGRANQPQVLVIALQAARSQDLAPFGPSRPAQASREPRASAFEARGITLAQALGRMAGLRDAQADARGVFIFHFEEPGVLNAQGAPLPLTPEGRVPVVYRLDLRDPRAFLVAQSFPMNNRDVVFVANAPAAELQKFLNILTGSLFTVNSLVNLGR